MRIGISGHRPDRLGGYDWNSQFNKSIRSYFRDVFKELLENTDNEITVIDGMALGFDQFIADVVISLKEEYKGRIHLEAAVPYKCQPDIWPSESRERYYKFLDNVDRLVYIDDLPNYKDNNTPVGQHSVAKLHLRNHYIVDTMDSGIVLFNGYSKGGTSSFVEYANKKCKPIFIVDPNKI